MEKPKSPCPIVCPRRASDCHRADICEEWGKYEKAYAEWHEWSSKEREKATAILEYKKNQTVEKLRDRQRKSRYRRRGG